MHEEISYCFKDFLERKEENIRPLKEASLTAATQHYRWETSVQLNKKLTWRHWKLPRSKLAGASNHNNN